MPSNNYCTSDEIKRHAQIDYEDLGYSSDATFVTAISAMIAIAESLVENFCNAPDGFFASGTTGYTVTQEIQNWREDGLIFTRYRPINSVTTVEYDAAGYQQSADWTAVTSTDYIAHLQKGIIQFVADVPGHPEQSIRLTYVAGWATAPDPVKWATIQIVCNVLHDMVQRKMSPTVRVDDWTIRIVRPEFFPPELKTLLGPYIVPSVSTG
jgi:hypothetical protein